MAMKSVNICVDPETDPPLETLHICKTQFSAFTSMHWLNQNMVLWTKNNILFFFYVGQKRQVFEPL